jgi:sarcosine oxidase subunit beta
MTNQTADIAIIGGGIIGLSCAYELARESDARIVLFDKQNIAGSTTGGSAGVICLHDMGALYAQLTLAGYARIQQLRRDHGFGFQAWGALGVVYEPHAVSREPNAYERRFGGGPESIYHKEVLSRDALLTRYPWIKPDGVAGGMFHPNQGYIDTYELLTLYERLATETGRVRVMRNTPVLQIRRDGNRIASLVTRRGEWRVGQVLNAAGPWGAKVAALAGRDIPLTPQRIQVCVATAFDDGVTHAPLTGVPASVNGEGVWCRGEIGDTLLFGQHHHTTQPGFDADPDFVNRVNDCDYPEAVASVYRRYWHLPKSVFLNGWCCVYGTTSDGFPILSRDAELNNFYYALGMNGHGMTCHAGIALATAELMLRGGTTLDLKPMTDKDEVLDFGCLDVGRFERGEVLQFDLA